MRRNEAKLILGLIWLREETLHNAKGFLLVLEHPSTINALEVEIKVSLRLTAANKLFQLGGLLGQQPAKVDRFHMVNGDLRPIPRDGLRDFRHDVVGVIAGFLVMLKYEGILCTSELLTLFFSGHLTFIYK